MKILLVNDYATPTAGAERITIELRDALRSRGHTVRVFASRAQLIAGRSFADATCFGTNSRLQTLSSAVNVSAARALERELRDFAPDVVQVQMFLWQLSPAILPLLRDVPSVYWVMTYKPVCPTGLKWLPSGVPCTVRAGAPCLTNRCITLTGFAPLMLQRQLWRHRRSAFDAVIGCSEAVRRELEADGIATREVIWPGSISARVRPPLSGAPTVTFAGRLAPEKGVDLLVRAFHLARARVPDARLLIAGTGPAEPAVRALVQQLALGRSVEMLGQLDEDGLSTMFDRSWVHAVPSRWPEPFGLTCTEAMFRGVAVVASDIGGLAEIVRHGVTGLHVPAGDEAALADALASLLADRARAEQFGEAGLARAGECFTIESSVDRFERLYDALLHRKPEVVLVG